LNVAFTFDTPATAAIKSNTTRPDIARAGGF